MGADDADGQLHWMPFAIEAGDLSDAARRTRVLARGMLGRPEALPQIAIVNPPLWEFGHIAWFAETWVLRHAGGRAPLHDGYDRLFDSATVAHATRFSLALPDAVDVAAYADTIATRVAGVLAGTPTAAQRYFATLACHHEDMHGEATLMTMQTLRRPWPLPAPLEHVDAGPLPGDVQIAGGRYRIGAEPGDAFVFDNEKWAHDVDVAAFRIARAPVTNAEYAAYVDAGGRVPRDWRRDARGAWCRARFGDVVALRPHAPVVNVSRLDADDYCAWAGRRLPTEAEWEIAATYDAGSGTRRRFPWGDAPPTLERASLDAFAKEPADVAAHPAGDSPAGVRGLIGNVWEWTSSAFAPYPGFVRDPYKEYSEPWFGDHAVLRGGSFATRARVLRGTWRNFYRPERSDAFSGFRTVALRDA